MMKNKKNVTKLAATLLAVILAFSAVPCAVCASSEYENIVLNVDNFTLSGKYSVIDTTGIVDKLFAKSVKVQRFDAISARFYIEDAGTYSLWFLSGAVADDVERFPKVTVDTETAALPFSKALEWKQAAKTWSLEAGWHTVSITTNAEWKPFFINAIYITNDPAAVPTTAEDDGLTSYTDNTAPVIDGADIEIEFNEKECSVKFPAATDANNVIYEYAIGGVATAVSDITQTVNIGKLSGETVVTLTASDKFGNSAQRQFAITAPGGDDPSGGDDTPDGEHILLSGDNFIIPDYGSGNGYTANGGTATGNLFSKSVKIAGEDASKYITARVYIKEAGTYNLWVLSANELDVTNASFTSRVARAGFDGEFADCTPHKVHVWEKSMWELGEGWHTLNVGMKNSWGNVKINAVYITDDTDEAPDTSGDDYLLDYLDITPPQFGENGVAADYADSTSCTLAFPAADDENGVVETLYYINGELVEAAEGSVNVTGLKPLDKLILIAEAYDKTGNKAVLEDEYIASPVKMGDFSMLKDGETQILSDLSSLSAGDIVKIGTTLSNRTENQIITELSLCLYSAGYERMLLCVSAPTVLGANAENSPASVSLRLPGDFDNKSGCIIAATLWDKTSGEPYIPGIEIKGAAQ